MTPSDGGKGSERLHERTQIPSEEMLRRWEKAFGRKAEEILAGVELRTSERTTK